MFSNSVFRTPFSTPAAEAYFTNKIHGDPWNGDVTLVSTLRALLGSRIGNNDMTVSVQQISVSSSICDSYAASTLNSILDEKLERCSGSFTVGAFVSGDKEGNEKMFRHADAYYSNSDVWTKLTAITEFFRRSFDVSCFVDPANRRTLFIVKGYDMRRHHYLPIAAFPAVPWLFDPKKDRATEKELQLLNALCEDTPEKYLNALQAIADDTDFEAAYVRESLTGIDTAYERRRIASLKREIERGMSAFQDYQERIRDQLHFLNDKNTELFGLEEKLRKSDGKSVLADYFLCNKLLKLDKVDGTTITFHVNDYLTYFDEDMAERCINNDSSAVYESAANRADAKLLAAAVFIDQSVRIRTCAAYYLDVGGGFDAISNFDFKGDDYDRLPNPHINDFTCVGSYASQVNERLEAHDMIGALELAVASAKSINFGDYTVISRLFREIFSGKGGQCFELADGTRLDLNEVIKYLKEQKAKEEDANE